MMRAIRFKNLMMGTVLTLTALTGCNFPFNSSSNSDATPGSTHSESLGSNSSGSALSCELTSSSDVVVRNNFLSSVEIFGRFTGKPTRILFNGVSQRIPQFGSLIQMSVSPQTDTQYTMEISDGKKTASCSRTINFAPCHVSSNFDGTSYSMVLDGSTDFTLYEVAYSINDGSITLSSGDNLISDNGGRVETAVRIGEDSIEIDNSTFQFGPISQVEVIYTVSDDNGNSQSCSQKLLP